MIKHLPVLLIVVPLLSALIIPLAGRINRALSWYIATIATGICFVISLSLLQTVLKEGKISYWLGGWAPPMGIEYVIDYLSIFVVIIVTFIAFMVSIYSKKSIELEIDEGRTPVFYAVYLLFITGLMGIVVTGDIFNLYVFLEITSIAGYALIAIGKKRQALMASFKYVVMGTIGATFILLGIGYLYLMTGTLNMAELSQMLPHLYSTNAVLTAFALFAVGLSLKIALFPLHTWLPNAYAYAPSAVSAAMAATATKVGAYALIRILFTIFGVSFMTFGDLNLAHIFLFFSVVAILAGSILAVSQTDIKKMLAYSSVGQIGYIVLGISLMSVTGMIGSLIHILNHALMKGGLFLVVGAVVYKVGITNIEGYKGLGKKMPISMAAFTIGALSMIGVPLTVGFVSKWYLAVASLEVGMWWLLPVILVSSLLTAVYFWRVVDNIYFKTEEEEPGHGHGHGHHEVKRDDAPAWMLVPTVTVSVLCIVFGILAYAPVALAEKAAVILLR